MLVHRNYKCAYITDNQEVFLKPDGAFIYCIGERKAWRDDMMGIHTNDLRAQAAFISKDMFSRRIKQIVCDDTLSELLEAVKGLHEIDGRFNLAGGLKVLENIWTTLIGRDVGIVNSFFNSYVGKPCVIVAGGPSAAVSYDTLKEMQGKVIIIAVGSGICGLAAAGIVPDYVVSIDPFDEMAFEILPVAQKETTLIADIQTNARLIQQFPGEVFVYASDYDKRCVPELSNIIDIPTNTTASTSAFQFAIYCGFEPIVLMGMDFCYNMDRKHVADIFTANSKDFDKILIDQDGVERATNAAYLDTYTFMNMVVPQAGRTVYNIKETGAGIAGTIPIHLKDFEYSVTAKKENPVSTLKVTVDKIAILRSIELMLLKVRGYKKRFNPETFDDWFSRLRLESAYKYLAQHLDWVWFELDDKAAVLNRAEFALVTLRSLLLGEVAKDA